MRPFDHLRICQHCESRNVKLRRKRIASGEERTCWLCLDCEHHAHKKRPWISKKTLAAFVERGALKASDLDRIPFAADYAVPCEVCGAMGAEYHHMAPQSLAEIFTHDWDHIGRELCKTCHDEWHEIVTPYMHGRGATDAAKRSMNHWRDELRQRIAHSEDQR